MDDRLVIPLGIMLLSAGWCVATMIRIQEYLRRRGRKVNSLLLRIMIFRYVGEYRRITQQELGHPGILYQQFVIANLLMLTSAVILLLTVRSI